MCQRWSTRKTLRKTPTRTLWDSMFLEALSTESTSRACDPLQKGGRKGLSLDGQFTQFPGDRPVLTPVRFSAEADDDICQAVVDEEDEFALE